MKANKFIRATWAVWWANYFIATAESTLSLSLSLSPLAAVCLLLGPKQHNGRRINFLLSILLSSLISAPKSVTKWRRSQSVKCLLYLTSFGPLSLSHSHTHRDDCIAERKLAALAGRKKGGNRLMLQYNISFMSNPHKIPTPLLSFSLAGQPN